MKQNNTILWGIGILVIGILLIAPQLGLFVIDTNSMTRTSSSTQVEPGQSFQISYKSSSSGIWGASIVDTVSGGCKFPDGTNQLKTVMLSSDGSTKTITINSPSFTSSCTFSGDYKFGTEAIKNFPDKTIKIKSNGNVECSGNENKCEGTTYYQCSSNKWQSQGKVDGKCGYNGDDIIEPPTLNLDKVLFKIGDFGVTFMHLIILIILSFAFSIITRK